MSERLANAIGVVRQHIDAAASPTARLRLLWAGAKNARRLAAADVVSQEFMRLADEAGLTARGPGDVRHVLQWAAAGLNPFGEGPLHDRD